MFTDTVLTLREPWHPASLSSASVLPAAAIKGVSQQSSRRGEREATGGGVMCAVGQVYKAGLPVSLSDPLSADRWVKFLTYLCKEDLRSLTFIIS